MRFSQFHPLEYPRLCPALRTLLPLRTQFTSICPVTQATLKRQSLLIAVRLRGNFAILNLSNGVTAELYKGSNDKKTQPSPRCLFEPRLSPSLACHEV
jgi:hypothetical protein